MIDQQPESVDVVIVGAGFGGLSSACDLARRGYRVRVLEARDRVGGRVVNLTVAGGAMTEGGGQYVGPTQHRLMAIADEYRVARYPTYHAGHSPILSAGMRLKAGLSQNSTGHDAPALIAGLQAIADRVPVDAPWAAPSARELDAQSVGDWLTSHAQTTLGAALLTTIINVMFGAEPSEVSLLFAGHYIAAAGSETDPGSLARLIATENGAQAQRFAGGSQVLAQRMADSLGAAVTLAAPVRGIDYRDDSAIVHTDGGRVSARRVIVAIPPQLAARIEYRPALPILRQRLLESLPLGALTKIHAVYDTPFWRRDGLSGGSMFIGPADRVSMTFDNTPAQDQPGIIFAFAGGARARSLAQLDDVSRRAIVIAQLEAAVGQQARYPIDYIEKHWHRDEWAGGGPGSCAPPGVLTDCGHVIRDAVGPIHWAGTETATYWTGYIEGAVQSGQRAAAEIDEELGRM